jgi:hypothetical protein
MRVLVELLAPAASRAGVEHAEEADFRAEVLRVGGNLPEESRRWCGTRGRRRSFYSAKPATKAREVG